MNDFTPTERDELYSDKAEWIAAEVRQLFRASQAEDAKAVEVCLFYLYNFLVKTLGVHLREDSRWDTRSRWLDAIGDVTPEIQPPTRLRIRGDLVWATRDQEKWYLEPFEFEIELCPHTGTFLWYTFRFADFRPLDEKRLSSPLACETVVGPGDAGWAFVFHREIANKT